MIAHWLHARESMWLSQEHWTLLPSYAWCFVQPYPKCDEEQELWPRSNGKWYFIWKPSRTDFSAFHATFRIGGFTRWNPGTSTCYLINLIPCKSATFPPVTTVLYSRYINTAFDRIRAIAMNIPFTVVKILQLKCWSFRMTIDWSNKGQGKAKIKPLEMSGFISHQLWDPNTVYQLLPLWIIHVNRWTSGDEDHKVFHPVKVICG